MEQFSDLIKNRRSMRKFTNEELTQDEAVIVSSKDIQDFINDKTEMVSVDEILSETADEVGTEQNTEQ